MYVFVVARVHLSGHPVELLHLPRRRADERRARHALLDGRHGDARPERLPEQEHVARLRFGVGQDAARIDEPGDCEAVLRLGVVDAVPADDGAAGLERLLRAAREDLAQLGKPAPARKRHQRQRIQGRPAHRVDVAQRIRRRDGAVVARIVHHRREEIDGGHQRAPRVETIDGRIVPRLGADE